MRILQTVVAIAVATALSSCGGGADGGTGPAASYTMTVTPSTLSIALAAGSTASANAQVGKKLGTSVLVDNSAFVTWRTSDASVATVTPSGLAATITGVGHGTAIITAESNGASGSTSVTVTAPTCNPLTASNPSATPGAISGSLGPADCRDDRASAAGRPADFYRVVVGSDQLLTIDVSASGFTPDIRLISPTATVVDLATGAAGRIQRAVSAGTYTIAVGTSSGSGGTYSVTLASAAISRCQLSNSTTTAVPATIAGTLTVTDCRLSENTLPAAKLYKFTLTSAQNVTAVLASTAFQPHLSIDDANMRSIADGRDSVASNQSRATTPLAAGDYYVIASGTSANPLGAFTLTLSTATVQAGPLAYLYVSQDSLTLEMGHTWRLNAYGYDANFATANVTATWAVIAGGGTIDTTGEFKAGTTAGIFANTIRAKSGAISSTNRTTVTVIPVVPSCTTASAVSTITPTLAGTTVAGSLTASDCKLPDGYFYAKFYRLTVATPATVQIDLASTRFYPYLYLFDSTLNDIETSGSLAGASGQSRISRSLAAGTYFIGVNSAANGNTGPFTVTVKTVP